jgi:xanthine dehydrogenase large subunit
MEVDDNVLPQIIETLAASSDYQQRCLSLRQWNAANPIKKRGLGWMPVKYGIAYNAIFLNQASAIVNIYTDGSVTVNHGGTEMGQGLFVKVAQVVAHVLGIGTERVKPTTSDTGRIPNASATSASSGTDLNGMAAYRAAVCLRDRLSAWVNQRHGRAADARVDFVDGEVRVGDTSMSFAELVRAAYFDRIQLTALGYYTVPKIHYNTPGQLSGRPYYYFTYGAALTEVQVDLRTGELEILRVDALQDAGVSINPAVDLGQIEGGIVQGLGWLTTEELSRDHNGRLLTHSPSTYKIPLATDVPPDFRAELWASGVNREKTIFRSKATGEPPFSLAMSVYSAVRWALASAAGGMLPAIDAPLSAERILFAAQRAASQTPVCVAPQLDLPPVTALTSRTPA